MTMLVQNRLLSDFTYASDSGTFQHKLPRQGMFNALEFFVACTNGATSCKDQDVYSEVVDRVEVIANGSKVLFSMTGMQCLKLAHAYFKQRPSYYRDEYLSVAQRGHFVVPFAWSKEDPNYYLDCSRYQDLELRITVSPTIAATSFATGTIVFTIYGWEWEQGSPGDNLGYLRVQEQEYWTSLAAGNHDYDLPIGNPYAAIGLYVYESGIDPQANIDSVELIVDDGKWSPVEGEFEDLNAMFTQQMGINPCEHGRVYKSDTDTIETRCGSVDTIALDPVETITTPGTTDVSVVISESYAGGLVTLGAFTRDAASAAADVANTTDLPIKWFATPLYGLGNFLLVNFGLLKPEYSFISQGRGRVRFRAVQGNAGAECRLSLFEYVPPGY